MRRKRAKGLPGKSPNPENPLGCANDILEWPKRRALGRTAIVAQDVLDTLVDDTLTAIDGTLRITDHYHRHPPEGKPPDAIYLDAA